MKGYVLVRLTVAQAQAAGNACDLIRGECEADGRKLEAALYQRTANAIDEALASRWQTDDHT